MSRSWVTIMLATGAAALCGPAVAGDVAAGARKAQACLECHEPAEDFAGQSAEQIAAKLASVSMGEVEHEDEEVKLSEADIADIAAFFASGS